MLSQWRSMLMIFWIVLTTRAGSRRKSLVATVPNHKPTSSCFDGQLTFSGWKGSTFDSRSGGGELLKAGAGEDCASRGRTFRELPTCGAGDD
ncbi:hypothetical protein BKA80DRAFT_278562 [Phyllosticta citrichinensis]